MLYILAGMCGFLLGFVAMSLFAASGAQDREREFGEYVNTIVDDLTKIISAQAVENDEQHAIIGRLEARLDGRDLTAQEKAA